MLSGKARVGGVETNASVLILDIADFTSFSERYKPAEVVRVLNIYLNEFTKIIINNNGYVNKFTGDGLLALFGSPEPDPEHSSRALYAAFLLL